MLFVSSPSLAITIVFAAIYLVNLSFYVFNRQKDADYVVEVVDDGIQNRFVTQSYTEYAQKNTEQNNSKKLCSNNCFLSGFLRNDNLVEIIFMKFYRTIPDITFCLTKTKLYRNIFYRPPPILILY